jgi:hypothetical protein
MHCPYVMASASAQKLVQEVMLFLTMPAQRDALTSPRTTPRKGAPADHLVPAFNIGNSRGSVDVSQGVIARLSHAHFHGAIAPPLPAENKSTWRIRCIAIEHTALRMFLGIAKVGTPTNDANVLKRNDNKVGILIGAIGDNPGKLRVGDTFRVTAHAKVLRVEAELASGRSS